MAGIAALPAPTFNVPNGYTVIRNADGSATLIGARGGIYNSTGRYTVEGKPIYKNNSGGYVTLEGVRAPVAAPVDYSSIPVRHVCTNKCTAGRMDRWHGERNISVSLMGLA